MARFYFRVEKSGLDWEVRYKGQSRDFVYPSQHEAVDSAAEVAEALHAKGLRSGVRIQGADGEWRDERIFGDDPSPYCHASH